VINRLGLKSNTISNIYDSKIKKDKRIGKAEKNLNKKSQSTKIG